MWGQKDISKYMISEYAKSPTDILLNGSRNPAISYYSNDFARIRYHLLVVLSNSNAHRTVVLMNFTITDYRNGLALFQSKQANADSDKVFIIANHKTAGSHMAATLAVSVAGAELLAGYMEWRERCG